MGVNVDHYYYYELGTMNMSFQKDIIKHFIPILNNTSSCVKQQHIIKAVLNNSLFTYPRLC